ncbi:hypothetical protein [Pseudomonas syringae]
MRKLIGLQCGAPDAVHCSRHLTGLLVMHDHSFCINPLVRA